MDGAVVKVACLNLDLRSHQNDVGIKQLIHLCYSMGMLNQQPTLDAACRLPMSVVGSQWFF